MWDKVACKDAPHFLGRKNFSIQNVLVVCSFDMKFIYVLFSKEGPVSNSRIFRHTLNKWEDKLKILSDKLKY